MNRTLEGITSLNLITCTLRAVTKHPFRLYLNPKRQLIARLMFTILAIPSPRPVIFGNKSLVSRHFGSQRVVEPPVLAG